MKKIAVISICLIMLFGLVSCKSSDYDTAMRYYDEGNYAAAEKLFGDLGTYKDSVEWYLKAKEAAVFEERYQEALNYIEKGDAVNGLKILIDMIDYKDAQSIIDEHSIEVASELLEGGNIEDAKEIYSLGSEDANFEKTLANYEEAFDMILLARESLDNPKSLSILDIRLIYSGGDRYLMFKINTTNSRGNKVQKYGFFGASPFGSGEVLCLCDGMDTSKAQNYNMTESMACGLLSAYWNTADTIVLSADTIMNYLRVNGLVE